MNRPFVITDAVFACFLMTPNLVQAATPLGAELTDHGEIKQNG